MSCYFYLVLLHCVVFGTLVGMCVFSVMWSELLMMPFIGCPLIFISVRVPERGVCVHISSED